MTRPPRERCGDAARVTRKTRRQVGGDDRVPAGVGVGVEVVERRRAAQAGVVDQDVDPPRNGRTASPTTSAGSRPRPSRRRRRRTPRRPRRRALRRSARSRRASRAASRTRAPSAREPAGDRLADASRGAGDEGGLPREASRVGHPARDTTFSGRRRAQRRAASRRRVCARDLAAVARAGRGSRASAPGRSPRSRPRRTPPAAGRSPSRTARRTVSSSSSERSSSPPFLAAETREQVVQELPLAAFPVGAEGRLRIAFR